MTIENLVERLKNRPMPGDEVYVLYTDWSEGKVRIGRDWVESISVTASHIYYRTETLIGKGEYMYEIFPSASVAVKFAHDHLIDIEDEIDDDNIPAFDKEVDH